MLNRLRTVAATALCIAATTASQAEAQNICFPTPLPVPFLPGAPSWAANDPTRRTELNEPRWGASPLTRFSNDPQQPETGEGGYRFILSPDGKVLSVSIQNKADKTADPNDAVFFGLYASSGAGRAVRLSITNPTASDPYFYMLGQIQHYTFKGTAGGHNNMWDTAFGQPDWLSQAAHWTKQRVEAGGADWGVQFKVDLKKIGILPDTAFKIAISMHKDDSGVTADVTVPAYPRNTSANDILAGTTLLEDPNKWFDAPKLSQGCLPGIEIAAIGTTAGDNTVIDARPNAVNRFYADLITTDSSTQPLLGNEVSAEFRIANWGAQIPGDALVDKSRAGWKPIVPGWTPTVTQPLPPPPTNWTDSYEGSPSRIQFACAPNPADGTVCGLARPTDPNQCMIAELSQNAGHPDVRISKAIVYNNMRFEGLSRRDLDAEVSIKGLRDTTGVFVNRDIYFDVITRNMPEHGNFPRFLDSYLLNALKSALLSFAQAVNPFGLSLSKRDQMKVAWPMYETHVYYDTLRTNTVNGKTYKVMEPMNSFGYYFSHSGVYYGFTHTMAALGGNVLNPLTTDAKARTYVIRQVRAEQSVKVRSGVSADEVPRFLINARRYICDMFPWSC